MSQEQINRNPDLKRLQEAGYSVEVKEAYLILHDIPYVNSLRQVKFGILISDLSSISGDNTVSPIQQHIAYFSGDSPCTKDGVVITSIYHSPHNTVMGGITVNHQFSNKPPAGYRDYYEKMSNYATIIANEAKAIDSSVTEKPHQVIMTPQEESVFNYSDTNSSRAGITTISKKLEGVKIAIVGLGGTGSYILDLIAKTPVSEIHLYDEDEFINNNAFRSPGAASEEALNKVLKKTVYFQTIYSNMHKKIFSHPYSITDTTIPELLTMNYVFLAIDTTDGAIKKHIIDHLIESKIPFIDTGIGLLTVDDMILGQVRITACTPDKNDHINSRIPLSSGAEEDVYATNIQIAELNALSAVLAVIKWKKFMGFYQDLTFEFNTTYSINNGILVND